MPTEALALVVPMAFVSLLLWLRLRAGGATAKQTGQVLAWALVWSIVLLAGIAMTVGGWRSHRMLMMGGVALSVTAFVMLRCVLRQAWERFPLE